MRGKRIYRSLCALALAALVFASAAVVTSFAEDGNGRKTTQVTDEIIGDGIYNIINNATNEALNVFDRQYDREGKTYLSASAGEAGQDFIVRTQEDGSYILYPQSTDKPLSYGEGARDGAAVGSVSDGGEYAKFTITKSENGYIIAPANAEESNLVLKMSGDSLYNFRLARLGDSVAESGEFWTLYSVDPSAVVASTTEKRVALYAVGNFHAHTDPAIYSSGITWSSSDESVILVGSDGSYCALAEGSAVVTASFGELSAQINVEVSADSAFTWYSQHMTSGGGWNGDALSNIWFTSGAYKKFIINGYGGYTDWMDKGCAMTSIAMVLHNLDARMTEGYDFRSGENGNLEADPYTVALANTGNTGGNENAVLYGNPINVVRDTIASRFTVDGKAITITSTYGASKKAIKEALDKHPEGVIVGMQSYSKSHYIVIGGCENPDAENANDYRFIVFDSAASERAEGDGVLFEDSISYRHEYYRYGNMTTIMTIDIID